LFNPFIKTLQFSLLLILSNIFPCDADKAQTTPDKKNGRQRLLFFLARVDIYDPNQNLWAKGTELPKKLLFSGVAASENTILIVGGWDEQYKATSIVLEGKCAISDFKK
jgi:hypothetical protein